MKTKIALLSGLALLGFSGVAFADSFSFTTAPGAQCSCGGTPQAVDAATTITTSDGMIIVDLSNNLAGQKDVGQSLSDIFFDVSQGTTTSTTYDPKDPGSALFITINKDNSFDTDGLGIPGWSLDLATAGTIHLCDIGNGVCNGATKATETIVGPGPYGSANGSLENSGHNPMIQQNAEFRLLVPGVTSSTQISNVIFSFGTTAGDNVPGSVCTSGCTDQRPPDAPEPGSLLLLGTGLIGGAALLRRRLAL